MIFEEQGTPTVLAIGARPHTLELAAELGVELVNLQHPSMVDPTDYGPGIVKIYLDYTDLSTLLKVGRGLHREFGFSTAFSLTEPGSVPAAALRSELGLRGHGLDVARTLHDKAVMRAAIAGTPGLVDVGHARVQTVADIESFAAQYGYPVILKPVGGTASIGVHALHDATDAADALSQLEKLRSDPTRRFRDFFPLAEFMVEQLVGGPEFSVECFSFAGEHVVLGVTEKLVTPAFAESGHVFPARYDASVIDLLGDAATKLLSRVGVTDGPSHTELKLTDAGPVVIESHDRVGGDRIFDLVRLATGFDPERATVAWAAGLIDADDARVPAARGAATRFAFSSSGIVETAAKASDILALRYVEECTVDVVPGSVITDTNGNWDRAGQVICVAPDSATAADAAEAAVAAIDIVLKEKEA